MVHRGPRPWVNRVAAKLLPGLEDRDSRVSATLVPRTFRHYVTLGCIDPGRRVGRRTVYGQRHLLQALLVRRLLADGVTARRMPELVSGSGNQELRRMVLGGVEVVVRPGGTAEDQNAGKRPSRYQETLHACSTDSVSDWTRVALSPGIELHLSGKSPKMTAEQRRQMLKRIEELVKQLSS